MSIFLSTFMMIGQNCEFLIGNVFPSLEFCTLSLILVSIGFQLKFHLSGTAELEGGAGEPWFPQIFPDSINGG